MEQYAKESPKSFKMDIQYRLSKVGVTQQEFAERIGITPPYLSNILVFANTRDTPSMRIRKEQIVEELEKLEGERKSEVHTNDK